MKEQYTYTGRGGEKHALIKIDKDIYKVVTDYPIGTTGRLDEILAIDFSGGPMLVVGELIDFGLMIDKIYHCNEIGMFIKVKED